MGKGGATREAWMGIGGGGIRGEGAELFRHGWFTHISRNRARRGVDGKGEGEQFGMCVGMETWTLGDFSWAFIRGLAS
jgi:hypothetical protein